MTTGINELDDALDFLMRHDQASVIAIGEIAAERRRQIEREFWSPGHDDTHRSGELAAAASCYANAPHTRPTDPLPVTPSQWPWASEWWKPKSLHRNRVRAAALLVAELARWLRIPARP